MDPIKILPHHAISYFEVFYFNSNSEEVIKWYNKKMRQNGVDTIKEVVNNPNQLVKIVSIYDEWCRVCPHSGPRGDRYKEEDVIYRNHALNPNIFYEGDNGMGCNKNVSSLEELYSSMHPEKGFANILGLEEVLNKEPISAETLFKLMKPTYDKLMFEFKLNEDNKSVIPQIVRVAMNMGILTATNKKTL